MSANTHQSLQVSQRDQLGNSSKKLRRHGLILGVVYGHNFQKSISISLSYGQFEKVYRTAGSTGVIDLELDGKKVPTLVHDLQYHPVTDNYLHVDFLAVNLKTAVEATVPLVFTGVSRVVKEDGAALNKMLESVQVMALPDLIPHELEVDISPIVDIHTVIRVSDLIAQLPKGVEILDELSEVIASASFVVEQDESTETPETVVETGVTPENNAESA